jgi:hypothetical protein
MYNPPNGLVHTMLVTRTFLEPKSKLMSYLPKWQWLMKLTHEKIDKDFRVLINSYFWKGEPTTFTHPGERGCVEFDCAYYNNKPFELTLEEIGIAEDVILDSIREEISLEKKKEWNI